jgi:hypothetical protein
VVCPRLEVRLQAASYRQPAACWVEPASGHLRRAEAGRWCQQPAVRAEFPARERYPQPEAYRGRRAADLYAATEHQSAHPRRAVVPRAQV